MIKGVNLISETLQRNPTWFDPSQDWTRSFYYRVNSTPPVNSLTAFYISSDNSFSQPYLFAFIDTATNNFIIEYFNGSTFLDSTPFVMTNGTNYFVIIEYNSATHTVSLYINATLTTSISVNLTTFVGTYEALFLGGGNGDFSQGYENTWQRLLTAGEKTAQQTSITPVSTTGLLDTCPLQTSIDLTDHLGAGLRLWFPVNNNNGCVTDTSDPLLSIVAGPPANITPATALSITLDSAIFIDTLSAGVAAAETWYSYTAVAGDRWFGSMAFGDLVTFKPRMFVYEGLANANSLTPYKNLSPANNGALQYSVTTGNTYYFRAIRNGAVTPATAIISVLRGPNLTVPVGAIAINDDTSNEFVAVFASSTIDNVIYNFAPLAAGEQGDVLPTSGFSLVSDQVDGTGNYIYNNLFQNVVTNTTIVSTTSRIRTCNTPEKWYISNNTNPPTVRTIIADGTVGSTTTLSVSTSLAAHAAANDEVLFYYAQTGTTQAVKTWNLVTNTTGANLVAGVAGYVISDILYLENNTIAVMYYKSTVTRDALLKVYDTTGSVIVSQSLGIPNGSTSPRMCYAIDDPTTIWVYLHITGEQSLLKNVTSSTGAVVTTRTVPTFESAASVTPTTSTPPRFGASFSCPIWVVRISSLTPANPGGGIYLLTGTSTPNPRQNHDTIWVDSGIGTTQNLNIPDPTFESYLAGDE